MMSRLTSFAGRNIQPLIGQRLVVLDPGSRYFKVLVVETVLGRARILHRQTIDLQEEGLLAQEEVRHHLEAVLPKLGLGDCPLAIVIPQHRTISQVIELPTAGPSEVRKQVEAEAVKLSGYAEGTLHHDFARLKPFGRYRSPAWLTLCRETELTDQIHRFAPQSQQTGRGLAEERLSETTTTAQALFAAGRTIRPRLKDAVLVDLGANNTVVALVVQGQGVFTASFPMGGNQFTDALAKSRGCPVDEAEVAKRSENLFTGDRASPAYIQVIEAWHSELKRTIAEWIEDNPDINVQLSSLPVYLCGGGACQEGLVEFLNTRSGWRYNLWPPLVEEESDWPMEQYWVAYGAALQALGKAPHTVSLLPEEFRAARSRRLLCQRLQGLNLVLLLTVFCLLAVGTWQKAVLVHRKTKAIARTKAAIETVQTVERLSQRLNVEYEQIRPVLDRQRESIEALEALASLQQAKTNRDLWFVLFADQASYFAGTTAPVALTNATNNASFAFPTNIQPSRPEFISELCIPQEGEETRKVLTQVVGDLKRNPLFAKVDALPPERKRNLVDPKVVITNRVFAISMEVGGADAQSGPVTPEKPAASPARDTRPGWTSFRSKAARSAPPAGGTNR